MKCAFRLAQEGMRSIFSYVGEARKVQICKNDLIMLLQNDDPHTPPEIDKLSQPTQERLKDFGKENSVIYSCRGDHRTWQGKKHFEKTLQK